MTLKTNIFYITIAIGISFSSCVSRKEYKQNVAELNDTKSKLNTAVIEQENLKKELSSLKTSTEMYKKESAENQKSVEYDLYKTAQQTGDYNMASISLARLVELDTPNRNIYYDSLAFYHYFYLYNPGTVRQTGGSYYYTMKGLTINPQNNFLLEIKAKLDLEEQRDTMSKNAFERLYVKTGDYTFLWDVTFIILYAQGNVKKADSIINSTIKRYDSEFKTVRLEHIQEKIKEEVPARAAFLYLRAVIQNSQGLKTKAIKSLEDAIKISPNFYYAKATLQQIKNPQQQQGYR